MHEVLSKSFHALIVTAFLAGASPVSAQELDTSKLPRVGGSTQLYASPLSTIFNTKGTVAATADVVRGLLAAQGWQLYSDPFSQPAPNPAQRMMSLKKDRQALSVFIRLSPAQDSVSVSYNALPPADDLPFPADAADIGYAPERPHLQLRTAQSIEATLAFFRKELADRGWSLWSRRDEAKQTGGPDGEIHDKTAIAYYVQDGKRPMLLSLNRDNDGVRAELKAVPPSLLVAQKPQEKPAAPAPDPQRQAQHDAVSSEIDRAIRGAIGEAFSGMRPGAPPQMPPVPQMQPPAAAETLRPLAGNTAPIPVPDGARDIALSGGNLEFKSAASVASLAAFYRGEMKAQGWQERPTPINRPNMTVLDFRKDGRQLNLTIMQMGRDATVRGDGSALAAEAKRTEPRTQAAKVQPGTPQELKADQMGGLPVPASSTSKGTERTPFRTVLSANVRADVASLLTFYRTELAKLNWTEQQQSVSTQPERAVVAFASPEGPAVLKLERKGSDTVIELALRKPDAANKAGMLPKPGQSKLVFGNVMDKEATITINKRTVKIGPGVGSRTADGPKLDLPPGKYSYSLRVAGQPPQNDEVTVGPDEAWGLMVGPGGGLALQAY